MYIEDVQIFYSLDTPTHFGKQNQQPYNKNNARS